jgi:hypothetical protein
MSIRLSLQAAKIGAPQNSLEPYCGFSYFIAVADQPFLWFQINRMQTRLQAILAIGTVISGP